MSAKMTVCRESIWHTLTRPTSSLSKTGVRIRVRAQHSQGLVLVNVWKVDCGSQLAVP